MLIHPAVVALNSVQNPGRDGSIQIFIFLFSKTYEIWNLINVEIGEKGNIVSKKN